MPDVLDILGRNYHSTRYLPFGSSYFREVEGQERDFDFPPRTSRCQKSIGTSNKSLPTGLERRFVRGEGRGTARKRDILRFKKTFDFSQLPHRHGGSTQACLQQSPGNGYARMHSRARGFLAFPPILCNLWLNLGLTTGSGSRKRRVVSMNGMTPLPPAAH
jgi:hypothetical protein